MFNNHGDNWKHGAENHLKCVFKKKQPTTSSTAFLRKDAFVVIFSSQLLINAQNL